MFKTLLTITVFLFAGSSVASAPLATRVLVVKSEHKLYVFAGETIMASYPVALGVNPKGHKQQQGDRRTPEGKYVLDWKNPKSAYYRSIHISYPSADDRAQAKAKGVAPGGDIMIHGQPNDVKLRLFVQASPFLDWTDGCIALSDSDMKSLWEMVQVPTPIEIRP